MIRQATSKDVRNIATLLEQKALSLKASGSSQWSAYLEQDIEQLVARDLEAGRLFVFEDQNELLGSVALLPSLEWDQSLWDDVEGLYIHRIVVSDRAKGRGVGRKLLEHAIAVTEDEGEILRLDCVASNEFLNAYYTSFGFVHQGTRDGFSIYEYERIEATA